MKQFFPEFLQTSPETDDPILFTGEMVFRGQFPDYAELAPLLPVADILATDPNWPDLYSEPQLAQNTVPVYSATFIEDMYVAYELAIETAGKIKGCKTFVTNVLYHNALGSKTDEVMRELFKLRDDSVD